jgi:hypothetical protein
VQKLNIMGVGGCGGLKNKYYQRLLVLENTKHACYAQKPEAGGGVEASSVSLSSNNENYRHGNHQLGPFIRPQEHSAR